MSSCTVMEECLVEEGAALIIRYGSWVGENSEPNDRDLVSLYRSKGRRRNFEVADWDVIRLSMREFNQYLRTLDPVHATEPLLGGELSYGSPWEFAALRDVVVEADPTQQAIRHNLAEGFSEFQRAQEFRKRRHYSYSVRALSFCLSHWATAWWYARENPPARIDEMVTAYGAQELYRELRARARNIEDLPAPRKMVCRLQQRIIDELLGVTDLGSPVPPK